MNILKFIESFADERIMQSMGTRRDSFAQFGNIGKNLAMASIPFGLSALSSKAFAKDITATPATPIGALQFALTLEYLEDEFYAMALDSGVIPASENGGRDLKVFQQISAHESDHVKFLIAGLGGTASANFVAKPTFDFTVGGAFDPFNDYPTFLALAQAFEDTGVRAYKGQAANLIITLDLLTAALQIHSVEARHASEVRRLRGLKGWISNAERGAGMPAATQAVYDGEGVTVQAGFNTAAAFGAAAGSEAYDEPLNTQQVVDIANIFIV
ncbi:ferritin-like domain-containing protein [Flavobacterium anhuiense]|uniref:ferritin-like domain-containing protein n=1 Tax=Flavobacterium anhuiense TaxID=459526 RepID=UPI0020261FE5|nr:ferritin-like domain-containing protein [Flavobacterium anhuiense]URM36109.1 ferritin-like domain-containing protein [Flavobacterium anhuiense]